MTEPITLGGVEVEDAFVDWNRNCSNAPTLQIILEDSMKRDDWLPLPDGIADSGRAIIENDGVWRGFEIGESFENRRTYDKATESGDEVTGTWSYDHTIKRHIEPNTMAATLSTSLDGAPSTFQVSIDKAQRIIKRFLNEDVNGTGSSYWIAKRDSHDWRRAVASKEQWDGFEECDVALVEGRVYQYKPKRMLDVNTGDDVVTQPIESSEVDV